MKLVKPKKGTTTETIGRAYKLRVWGLLECKGLGCRFLGFRGAGIRAV